MLLFLYHKATPSLDVAYSDEDDGEDKSPCCSANEEYLVLHGLSQNCLASWSLLTGPASKPSMALLSHSEPPEPYLHLKPCLVLYDSLLHPSYLLYDNGVIQSGKCLKERRNEVLRTFFEKKNDKS